MLLCVDVGNSNITFGIYKDKELIETFRMETKEITSLNQLSEQFSIITNSYSYLLNDFEVFPCLSLSIIKTFLLCTVANVYAMFTAVVVFPVPPFKLMIEITRICFSSLLVKW